MAAHSYRFVHALSVSASPERVRAVLLDLERYPSWWPQVRAVGRLDDDRALVVCRSVLPYDLELVLEAVSREPHRLEVSISGPIDGFARWRLSEVADGTVLAYEQQVEARGALAWASYVAKPVLRWNHAVMMRGFDAGLSAALADRSSPRPS